MHALSLGNWLLSLIDLIFIMCSSIKTKAAFLCAALPRIFVADISRRAAMHCVKLIDKNGRIVIPKYMREKIGINSEEEMDVLLMDDIEQIVLKRREARCAICSSPKNLKKLDNGYICASCAKRVSELI